MQGARSSEPRPYAGMEPDREQRTLIERIRWGNVGRLAALIGLAALILTGPHGCGGGSKPAVPPALEQPARVGGAGGEHGPTAERRAELQRDAAAKEAAARR